MKLSVWILYDELSEYSPKISVHGGARTIEDVRLFSQGSALSEDYVYICGEGDDVVLRHGRNTITIENADIVAVTNHVIEIFRKYRSWSSRMYMALSETNPFQAILDIAHEVFQCPMFIGSNNLQLHAITRQYSSEDVYYEWDTVKEILTFPLELMRRIKTKIDRLDDTSIKPIVFASYPEDNFRFPNQIQVNCFMSGQPWGKLYLYCYSPQISESVLQLSRYVGDIFGDLLNKSENRIEGKYTKYSSLVDLLDGKNVAELTVSALQSVQWLETTQLVLLKISSDAAGFDEMPYYWLCDNIHAYAANDVVFPYKNSIIVILGVGQTRLSVLLNYIKQLIEFGDYHCGVSFPFDRLIDIPTFFLQADYAIRFSKSPEQEKIHDFKDFTFEGIVQVFREKCQWRDWALPSLLNLVYDDKQSGTENFRTLYAFLQNNSHIANTAKELFIHRNTLIYRLKKTQQILDVDIYDKTTSAYLYFFCSLIAADYENQNV
ncbi:MAG: helix-turn-helix domain-containing protein [Oscillospiraceae bacterium]|jgi:hypothetical protein|nr:helix-turn-helix domain-containing protein [Oscillospiraceae bacterium]